MAYDLSLLTMTPDLRGVPRAHARLVCALRYSHVARCHEDHAHEGLARHLGCRSAIHSFHVFLDECGRAWPEPIALNPPCQPLFSYDEMLLADLATAAARNDRDAFDQFISDMIGESGRNAIWNASRRLMKHLVTVVR